MLSRTARRLRPLLALALLACSSQEQSDAGGFELEIVGTAGETLQHFRVLVSSAEGERALSCRGEGESDAGLRCTQNGVVVSEAAAGTEILIKAQARAFAQVSLTGADIEAGRRRVELPSLAPYEASDSYRSGIDLRDAEAWSELAVDSVTELGPAHSVKFLITGLGASPSLYLQNTPRFPVHYEFAQLALGLSMSRSEFASKTYQGEDRPQLAGTLTYYPELEFETRAAKYRAPIALEFFPSDDLSPNLVMTAHRVLEERVGFAELDGLERRLVYVPAGSVQEADAVLAEALFERNEALVADHVRFYAGVERQILNPGVAYGSLLLVTPEELETRVVSFRDLLVLTRLPNDLPLVGGTITEELQTPLAHVNLAARARGTPNLALKRASMDLRVAPLIGSLVRFEVSADGFSLEPASLEEAQAFWDSRAGEPLVPESDVEFAELSGFDEIEFADSIRFGAKAANLAELRRLLGDEAPEGFAVPFSAYHAYLRENVVLESDCADARLDCEDEGRRAELCQAAHARCLESAADGESFYDFAARLIDDGELATDAPLREACLDALAFLVRHGEVDPDFAARLDARVAELFGSVKVRLRSSTNAEDLPGFSGAGLYESLSAEGSGDRRPSRRIREVWASAFRFRAFEERALWNVDHLKVEVGIAVNRTIDDEVANGVLVTRNLRNPGAEGYYVNVQQGEVEVTNPEDGAVPEVFTIVPAPGGASQVVRERFSSLSPDAPLLRDTEVLALADAARRVQPRFASLYQQPAGKLALDLEFKIHGPDRKLLVKQARPYFERAP